MTTPTENFDSHYSYRVMVRCENCTTENTVTIPKGLRVREFPCPHCGCYALVPREEGAG